MIKKSIGGLVVVLMLISVPFIAAPLSNEAGAVSAQSIATRSKRKGRYVYRRTWDGTKWTTRKVRVGTRSTRRKSWRTGRKVVSRTKKILF